MTRQNKPLDVLLIEDDPGDVTLTEEALKRSGVSFVLNAIDNGTDALQYLRRLGKYKDSNRPALVFLDLNMPRMGGHEVLKEMKGDDDLAGIPVVVFTTSNSRPDILKSYKLHANCYLIKPVDLNRFCDVIKATVIFWSAIAEIPD